MRATPLLLLIALLQACACGGTKKPPDQPAGGDAGAVASGDGRDASPPADQRVTAKECDELADHLVALAARERAGKVSADAASTPDEIAATQATMRDDFRPSCLAETTAKVWQCAMHAGDRAGINACYGR